MDRRQGVDSVVRALRRVNFQGSIFGQSVAIRLGLSESDVEKILGSNFMRVFEQIERPSPGPSASLRSASGPPSPR